MLGTVINAVAILIGGLVGLFFGKHIPTRLRETLVSALGLFTMAYGLFIFSQTRNIRFHYVGDRNDIGELCVKKA